MTTRSKTTIFLGDDDRLDFLRRLDGVIRRHSWVCQAYCVLSTHYHLLVTTPNPDLAAGMQRPNGAYASQFNDRYGDFGHVFAGRYHSTLVEGDGHLLELFRYIALNPVRAGLCKRPASWLWSSYPIALGMQPAPRFLDLGGVFRLFGRDLERARERLRAFVED